MVRVSLQGRGRPVRVQAGEPEVVDIGNELLEVDREGAALLKCCPLHAM